MFALRRKARIAIGWLHDAGNALRVQAIHNAFMRYERNIAQYMHFQSYCLVERFFRLTLLLEHLSLRDAAVVQQRVGGSRPDIAHHQRGRDDRFLLILPGAHAHSIDVPILVQQLKDLAGEADLALLRKNVLLQMARQLAAAALHDGGRAVTQHIFRGAHNFGGADLAQFETEGEAGYALKKSDQTRVALHIDMTLKPEIKGKVTFAPGQGTQEH